MTKNTPSLYAFTWLNGALLPSDKALISLQDRGFRFGDGVFETLPVFGTVPYRLDYHLERMSGGLAALRIAYDIAPIVAACRQLIQKNAMQNGLLRISISRGEGSRGYLPEGSPQPTAAIECMDAPRPAKDPLTLLLSSYEKPSLRALPVHFKMAQGVNSTLARMEAAQQGAGEALLLNADGRICEASAANIFFLKDGKIHTPDAHSGCLLGVTRRIIIEQEAVTQGSFPLAAVESAEAVILTNAASGVQPVAKLLPMGWSWNSAAFAEQLGILLKNDREKYIHRHLA